MKSLKAIQYKALFLLITFSLNTVVGFACSIGVDMGFNSGHHSHEAKHQHKHGDQEHHHDKGSHKHTHSHNYSNDNQANAISISAPENENCCKNFTTSFNNLDKQLVQKTATSEKKKCDYAFFTFNPISLFTQPVYKEPVKTPPKFLPVHSPPDIRIFIQSFQI
ncbi:MAG: hypothetical protein J0I09_02800 [Sphingobacteriia bacterium]|nr:hypothetical protein [Sphingobacteriia bacterium]